MQRAWHTTCGILSVCILTLSASQSPAESPSAISIQSDGSLVFFDSSGGVTDLVKQGTPRQAVNCDGQSLNISYGSNSAGKKTILVSLPKTSTAPAVFTLSDMNVSVPPGSALRITLNAANQPDRMEGAPAGSVTMSKGSISSTVKSEASSTRPETSVVPSNRVTPQDPPTQEAPALDTLQTTPMEKNLPLPEPKPTLPTPSTPSPQESPKPQSSPTSSTLQSPAAMEEASFWPGKLLDHPIPAEKQEEDPFYIRTEGGPRFVSSMNIVNVVGPNGPSNSIIQKEIAFSTGYRQDIDAGVWLTDWFGLSIETGFALNAIRGNTQGMTVSSSTYWSVPIMAQLCFQYPNDSGFLPYINLGFGGGWNYFKIGSINYTGTNFTTLSGSGNDMNNAYQIAAGVRYRLYDQLSLTLAYKFYGTSQPTVDMGDSQQVTFGSPVTNTIEIGGNFAF